MNFLKRLIYLKKGTEIPKILLELVQNGSLVLEFDMDDDRTYLNTIIHIKDGFENKELVPESMSELMSKLMSELERTIMKEILQYIESNKEINNFIAVELLIVKPKNSSRLLSKAEKLKILRSTGKTRSKKYFI